MLLLKHFNSKSHVGKETVFLFSQEGNPCWPLVFSCVAEWCVASSVTHEQQFRTFPEDEFDEFKVGSMRPTGVVQRSSSVIIPHSDRHTSLFD